MNENFNLIEILKDAPIRTKLWSPICGDVELAFNHEGSISLVLLDSEFGKIIMDNYREFKLPEQWKDGDILINKDGTDYKVFWEYDSDSDTSFYAHNVSMHLNGTLTQYSGSIWHGEKIVCFIEDYRLATPSEAKQFHELLHNLKKEWDSENKEIVEWKWKPKEGDKYFYINSIGKVQISKLGSYGIDTCNNTFSEFGNYFKTKEEAEVIAEKIKKLLNAES